MGDIVNFNDFKERQSAQKQSSENNLIGVDMTDIFSDDAVLAVERKLAELPIQSLDSKEEYIDTMIRVFGKEEAFILMEKPNSVIWERLWQIKNADNVRSKSLDLLANYTMGDVDRLIDYTDAQIMAIKKFK